MTDLHKAAQQALEAMEYAGMDVGKFNRVNAACTALRAALAQQAEPKGGGNLPPPLQAEPVDFVSPQRKPLTDEEILKAVGWSMAEPYMKLLPNFPVAEAREETLKNARAIERAHGIGGQP
jgi:hypothetical protein